MGTTLLSSRRGERILTSRSMRYIAEISYALYVIHPITRYGWLGTGGVLVRYLKRGLGLGLTFALAHLSTFRFEHHWQAVGKRLGHRWEHRNDASPYRPVPGRPAGEQAATIGAARSRALRP